MNNNEKKKLILSLVMLPVSCFTTGFVLMKLWEYFVTPTFNLAEISFLQALGLSLVVSFLTSKIDWSEDSEAISFETFSVKIVSHSVTTPVLTLVLGYLVHIFM